MPFESDPAPACGVDAHSTDSAFGFAYTYVCTHAAGPAAAQGVAADGFVRPSAWSGTIEGRAAQFPTSRYNGQVMFGSFGEWGLKSTSSRALKTPKGQQGVLVITEAYSKHQHWKLQARCVDEEQRICARTGEVSTPERWCISAEHSLVRAFVFPRPL